MATIAEVIPALVTVLEGVTGITTVYDDVQQDPLPANVLPAIFLEAMPAVADMKTTTTRRIEWPIRIWISVGQRSAEITADHDELRPFPERVIAALDAAGTLGGLLSRTVEFDEPSVYHPILGTLFGRTVWNDYQYVETAVHARFTTQRVGGFGNG